MRLHAEGPAVSKAVTVAEIAKRRLRGVYQSTQIGLSALDGDGGRRKPRISITLSMAPLDSTGCAALASRAASPLLSSPAPRPPPRVSLLLVICRRTQPSASASVALPRD